jgi:hypothetical protein
MARGLLDLFMIHAGSNSKWFNELRTMLYGATQQKIKIPDVEYVWAFNPAIHPNYSYSNINLVPHLYFIDSLLNICLHSTLFNTFDRHFKFNQ